MMKRLLAEESLPSDDERLADLLRAAAPFEIDPFRKRRILVRIERGSATRKGTFWLRSAVALTLLISGSAAAAIGHHYAAPGTGFFGLAAPNPTTSQPARAASGSAARHAAPIAELGTNDVTPAPATSAAPSTSAAPPASTPRASPRMRPESSEDASNVVEAIQALRAGRDPARAQGLLDDYLKTHPRGVLSGDALALSIEAASARSDPKAADYARRYLALYPKGKYRDLAKRALSQPH